MRRFKNILVGVDLSFKDGVVSDLLPPPTIEAVERATWLAKVNSARITFFHALDVSVPAQWLIDDSDEGSRTLMRQANEALAELSAKAANEDVESDCEVRVGKSWLELIRHVQRKQHDLVVAGTRHFGEFKSLLVGNTGMKLLRKCPCPVWITQVQEERQIKSILVAHCLRPVGDVAMQLGCSMAQLHDSQLHVFHSLEFPELESTFPARVSAEKSAQYRINAQEHIQAQLERYDLAKPPQIDITTDAPAYAILREIERRDVDLVVMGTIARTGIAGFITGNTAERLLPSLPCSVLAVKPAGFVSPVVI